MAGVAKAQEAKFVVNHPKLARLLDPAAEAGQRVVRDGAARQFLNPPAALADQVGVMPGELLPELVAGSRAGGVDDPQEPRRHQEMDGAIDGDAVDPLSRHPGVNLLDREWAIAPTDGFQDGAARPGEAMTLSGKQVRKRCSRSNRCTAHLWFP